MTPIPFHVPCRTGKEEAYVLDAIARGQLSAKGHYTRLCERQLAAHTGAAQVLLTNSCTAALQMAAILAGLGPGDEVIMPSFTFPSTASACLMRGARPVFVDIRADTLNLDESRIEAAISARTRAIVVVHYAGVACAMDAIMAIARRHDLIVIEDAAHALLAQHQDRALGTIGHLGVLSFHATKNISCGEGGALLVNDARFRQAAEILRDKGTNREAFLAGQVRNYAWVGADAVAGLGELPAAYLLAQLEAAPEITRRRLDLWRHYDDLLRPLQASGKIATPCVPGEARHNAHIYYLLAATSAERDRLQACLRQQGIDAVSHYEPLHSSPAGQQFGAPADSLATTSAVAARILRLPLWPDMARDAVARVAAAVTRAVA